MPRVRFQLARPSLSFTPFDFYIRSNDWINSRPIFLLRLFVEVKKVETNTGLGILPSEKSNNYLENAVSRQLCLLVFTFFDKTREEWGGARSILAFLVYYGLLSRSFISGHDVYDAS